MSCSHLFSFYLEKRRSRQVNPAVVLSAGKLCARARDPNRTLSIPEGLFRLCFSTACNACALFPIIPFNHRHPRSCYVRCVVSMWASRSSACPVWLCGLDRLPIKSKMKCNAGNGRLTWAKEGSIKDLDFYCFITVVLGAVSPTGSANQLRDPCE
ncbi:hypothetical protein K469DRAFT_316840 [Zopfia rhizophila CBS 207.26]|uniref:Uncharacterized protein n=1 Tax=Zopfia rhizophila CBS 207.26 TaxID=1314779 RepID=A0A6A6ES03_9PEZI|nr:hypothetical protein K469DRAFT_316840 [Zopfia rhizophila CBS 207.26]